MANMKIFGDSAVITSTQTLENMKVLEKHNPKALCLFEKDENDKKEEVFRISTGPQGSLNQYGAVFAGESRDGEGFATITLSVPSDVEDVKEWAYERYGTGLMRLNKLEAALGEAVTKVNEAKATVLEAIETI